MQQFINNIYQFLYDIYLSIQNAIRSISTSWLSEYNDFMTHSVFTENSLIGINITYKELFIYIGVWFLTILIFVLFIKFILKMLKVITN